MRVWRFSDPDDDVFARASLRGTWSKAGAVCPDCTASTVQRVQPLIIEWEPGSDTIGDFAWPGFDSELAISDRALRVLREVGVAGFDPGPVEMIQKPKFEAPVSPRTSHRRRVRLPYAGPRLHDLWVTAWANPDRNRSSVSVVSTCQACGRVEYRLDGVERIEKLWDAERRELRRVHHPRQSEKGLFVPAGALPSAVSVFRVTEFPSWICCTEGVRSAITTSGLENVTFLELGEVI